MSSAVYTSKRLDHIALVAGFCQKIDLAAIIDKALGTRKRRQVGYGHISTAMLLNGLGFTGRTLHMYSEFFDDKPVSQLMGEGIEASHINDDALGRCLDALYDAGVCDMYQKIAEKVVGHLKLPCAFTHLDSTRVSGTLAIMLMLMLMLSSFGYCSVVSKGRNESTIT
jgi:transposase